MNDLATLHAANIPAMSDGAIAKVRAFEDYALQLPQVDISTSHIFHAGMYARTIMIPAGTVLTGALIKIATVLIMAGDATVYIGNKSTEFSGYHVIPASAHRKQAFIAHSDTYLTMIFPTDATIVEDAEDEFTDEAEALMSRKNATVNNSAVAGV